MVCNLSLFTIPPFFMSSHWSETLRSLPSLTISIYYTSLTRVLSTVFSQDLMFGGLLPEWDPTTKVVQSRSDSALVG